MNLKNIIFTVIFILLMGWIIWFFNFELFTSVGFVFIGFYCFWFLFGNKNIRSGFKLWDATIDIFPKYEIKILPKNSLKGVGFINEKPLHKLVVWVRGDGVLVNLFFVKQALSFYLIRWDNISRLVIDNLSVNKEKDKLYAEIHFFEPEIPKLKIPWCVDFEDFVPSSVAILIKGKDE